MMKKISEHKAVLLYKLTCSALAVKKKNKAYTQRVWSPHLKLAS